MGMLNSWFGQEADRTRSEKMYDEALALFNSAEKQNAQLPKDVKAKVEGGIDCDEIPDGTGAFGHAVTNPIPVNGSFGEMTYLSRLRLRATGSMVFFHKIKTIGTVDMFELINVSGKFVDYLYLDMYHPRVSRLYPAGYTLEKEAVFPRGVTTTVENFPKGLYACIKKEAKAKLGVDVAERESNRIDLEQAFQSLEEARGKQWNVLCVLP